VLQRERNISDREEGSGEKGGGENGSGEKGGSEKWTLSQDILWQIPVAEKQRSLPRKPKIIMNNEEQNSFNLERDKKMHMSNIFVTCVLLI
jgi:hypothetical protein